MIGYHGNRVMVVRVLMIFCAAGECGLGSSKVEHETLNLEVVGSNPMLDIQFFSFLVYHQFAWR